MGKRDRREQARARLEAIDDEIAVILRHFPSFRTRRPDNNQLGVVPRREIAKAQARRPRISTTRGG